MVAETLWDYGDSFEKNPRARQVWGVRVTIDGRVCVGRFSVSGCVVRLWCDRGIQNSETTEGSV